VSPLFRETNVQSELEIVQSEHEKNRCNDKWRTNQV
jgi:secreted Zn-dependent insulinase-like peptidase